MKNSISFIIMSIILLTPLVAIGQSSSGVMDQNALSQVIDLIFQILLVVLPVVATWLAHRGIAIIEKKTKISVPDAVEAKIDEWISQGIWFAAEKSHKKIKEKTMKLSGSEKLEEAADFVLDLAQSRGWVEWSKDRIKAKIEAKIGKERP